MTARLILLCGLPGSGKTTLARRLENRVAAVRLCPDDWLLDLGVDLYDEAARARLESVFWRHAQELLRRGISVILEFGFWSRAERDMTRSRAREIGVGVELHYLDLSVDELWHRIDHRNRGNGWKSEPVTREMLEGWLPFFEAPTADEFELFDQPLATADRTDFGAVILAGGRASRLGGVDKPSVPVAGVTMLERVVAVVHDAAVTVVVGPPSLAVPPGVKVVREHPPGGGPVAALAAALALDPWPESTVLLAGDMPLLTAEAIGGLIDALDQHDGAIYVDEEGREQWLCGAWRSDALRRRLDEISEPANYPLRRLLGGLDFVSVRSASEPPPWFDCDTEDDIRRAEEWLTR